MSLMQYENLLRITTPMGTFGLEKTLQLSMVFENHRKSLIQHCERSELSLTFDWTKVI